MLETVRRELFIPTSSSVKVKHHHDLRLVQRQGLGQLGGSFCPSADPGHSPHVNSGALAAVQTPFLALSNL